MNKHFMVVDPEFMARFEAKLDEISNGMKKVNLIREQEYLTAQEFMERTKISRWKFDLLINGGLCEYKKIGRKYYIPANQVTKFFAGEMNLRG